MLSVFVFVSVLFISSSGDLCKIERFPLHSVSSVSDCTIKEEKVHTQTTKKKKEENDGAEPGICVREPRVSC